MVLGAGRYAGHHGCNSQLLDRWRQATDQHLHLHRQWRLRPIGFRGRSSNGLVGSDIPLLHRAHLDTFFLPYLCPNKVPIENTLDSDGHHLWSLYLVDHEQSGGTAVRNAEVSIPID